MEEEEGINDLKEVFKDIVDIKTEKKQQQQNLNQYLIPQEQYVNFGDTKFVELTLMYLETW